jgi:hypothetical protein
MAGNEGPALASALRAPHAEIFAFDVSIPALNEKAELENLNQQPTSFVLSAEVVDRLRAAAGTIIIDATEFKRLLKDLGRRSLPKRRRATRCRCRRMASTRQRHRPGGRSHRVPALRLRGESMPGASFTRRHRA